MKGFYLSILFIVGTRPEAIKLFPLYLAFKEQGLPVKLCISSQHIQLMNEQLHFFNVTPDFQLPLSPHLGNLNELFGQIVHELELIYKQFFFSWVFVQGDTATTCAAAISAFNRKIKIAHVEAGLRTFDLENPYPEEGYRSIISRIATINYAPTKHAEKNLLEEKISAEKIICVGNTVVDALHFGINKINKDRSLVSQNIQDFCQKAKNNNQKIILLTAHRREAHGQNLTNIFLAIKNFLLHNENVVCIYPSHPNPKIQTSLIVSGFTKELLQDQLFFSPPLSYADLVYSLTQADCIATDSGGIQEEAISLGKPIICLRNTTERPEGIDLGLSTITGFDTSKITRALEEKLLQSNQPATLSLIYGDGSSCKQILNHFLSHYVSPEKISPLKLWEKPKTMNINVQSHKKSVCIVGVGYIGLPTALLAANTSFDVEAYDIDHEKITQLKNGITSIREHDLVTLLQSIYKKISFTTNPQLKADFFIIAVPTPFHENKTANVDYVWQAISTITPLLTEGCCIIIESTIPVFLTDTIAKTIEKQTSFIVGKTIFVAHCPERVLPGNTLYELTHNNRILGGVTPECAKKAAEFYAPFVFGSIQHTTAKNAELVKLIENSSRDVQIALANQIDQICTAAGTDSREVIALANQHPRVKILEPGCGVGGHCIAVDPYFLINTFPQATQLFAEARKINHHRPELVLHRILDVISKIRTQSPTRKLSIGIWGLTFKPNVDDMRESPALEIAQKLHSLEKNCSFHVVEPNVHPHKIQELGFFAEIDPLRSLEIADGIIILVKHNEFKKISYTQLKNNVIFDACGLLYDTGHHQEIAQTETLLLHTKKSTSATF
ncbi:UDP-N-acetylglucosamine 2-epimerase (non-hydrolyzing) [Candidatus Dependentiae bacterium]|nr:UDP-N-acetylglucosamine 2-epimerase (non-hydrolyzing) [Candidatus Dependentiae bacterium]